MVCILVEFKIDYDIYISKCGHDPLVRASIGPPGGWTPESFRHFTGGSLYIISYTLLMQFLIIMVP